MSISVNNQQKSQIPALNVMQFDAAAIGDAVNLFRGNLAFPLKLISLPSRGGLSLDVTLLYQSNVQFWVDNWNVEAQTDVVGLGWSLPSDSIVIDPKASGSSVDDDYYLNFQGQIARLVPIPEAWARGSLSSDCASTLNPGKVASAVLSEFQAQGISLSEEARIETGNAGCWNLIDDDHQRIYTLRRMEDGSVCIDSGGLSFELASYQFWQITFYDTYNKWEIVKEDGAVYTYGGASSSDDVANVVQWGIKWGNWIGNSVTAENQERYPVAWNLARIENIPGNFIAFSYAVTEQTVGDGTLTYTKECHLAETTNDLGWSCLFAYEPMTYNNSSLDAPKEYIDPHKDPALVPDTTPDAYQSRYITRYLDRITVFNHEGCAQLYLQFDYVVNNCTTPDEKNLLGYGGTYKRYLKSITQYLPGGDSKPGLEFDYFFSTDTDQNRGALKSILYPSGSTSSFNYDLISVGVDAQSDPGARNLIIPNPFGEKKGHARIWYGSDYVVCGWYDDDSSQLQISVFTWTGRWSQCQWNDGCDWLGFDMAGDLEDLQVLPSENTFLVSIPGSSGNPVANVYLFQRGPLHIATWQAQSEDGQMRNYIYPNNRLQIVAGRDFFIVNDQDHQVVDRYAWNWMKRDWEVVHLADQGTLCNSSVENDYTYYVTARGNYYIVYCYGHTSDTNPCSRFSLTYRDVLLNWHSGGCVETDDITIPHRGAFSYFNFAPGDSFAAIAFVTGYTPVDGSPVAFKAFDYSLKVLTWDENFENLTFADLSSVSQDGFHSVPTPILYALGPVFIDNTLIGSGPNILRYNGQNWNYEYLDIQYSGASDYSRQYYWYAYGENSAVKTENTSSGIYSSLSWFDPACPNQGWQNQVLEDDIPSERYLRGYPTLSGSYFTQDRRVYNCSVYPVWEDVDQYLLTTLDETQLDTTTINNQPPHFLAFLALDDGDYPKDTRVIFYQNGDLIRNQGAPHVEICEGQQLFQFLDNQHHYKNRKGKTSAISDGFITFPIGESIDEASRISLYRYCSDSIQDAIQVFVVGEVTTDTGYGQMHKCFQYNDYSAAVDGSDMIVRFHMVTEYEGCSHPEEQENGYTTSYFYNGLPPQTAALCCFETQLDSTSNYSMLDGMLIKKEQYDVSGTLLASTENIWTVVDQVAVDAQGTQLRNLYGGIVQVQSVIQMLDGVTTATAYTYSSSSGAACAISKPYYGSMGELITTETSLLFAYEEYPEMWNSHQLNPVAQRKMCVKTESDGQWQIQSIQTQTSRAWTKGDGQYYWAEDKCYIALEADASPFTWWNGDVPDAKWLCTAEIIQRGTFGEVLQSLDVQERPTIVLYDDAERFPIASFVNTADGVSYDSFEEYQTAGWQLDGAVCSLIDTDSFTGKQCCHIDHSGILSKTLLIDTSKEKYLFAGWFKTSQEEVSDNILLSLEIADIESGSRLSKSLEPSGGKWTYMQWVADLSQMGISGFVTLNFSVNVTLSDSDAYVLLDDLFIMPVESGFSAEVYDSSKLMKSASLFPNGVYERTVFNRFDQAAGQVGSCENTLGFTAAFETRQTADINEEIPFPQANPNSQLLVSGSGQGFYDQFKAGALLDYNFFGCTSQDWLVEDHHLQLITASTNPLGALVQRKDFQTNSLGIYVLVDSDAGNAVSLGTGSFFVQWKNSKWTLLKQNDDGLEELETNDKVDFQSEWILTIFDNRLLFFAGGIPIFNTTSEDLSNQLHGVLLGLQQPAVFYNLLVAENLSLELSYQDALGRPIQSLTMESGDSVILNAVLYDALGKEAISIKPSRITGEQVENPFQYYDGYVSNGGFEDSNSIWQDNPMRGPAAEIYHAEDGGYPFNRTIYETSPLKRCIKVGRPGADFAIRWIDGVENPHVDHYSYETNEDIGPFLYPLPVGQYQIVRHSDPDGNIIITYADTENHQIGRVVQSLEAQSGEDLWRTSKVFDPFGRSVASISPNDYRQSGTARKEPGEIPSDASTVAYDFLNRCIETSHPDQGISRCIYNTRSSLPRFMQDARGQEEGYIHYLKYDSQNRVTEEGVYTTEWDEETLQTKADDDANWPSATTWSRRMLYDGDDTTSNMVGRLWQAFANNSDSDNADVCDTISYDRTGNVVRRSRQVTAFSTDEVYATDYVYDNAGILVSTTDNIIGLTTSYIYNPLGQLIAINGTVGNETTLLVRMMYTQEDQFESTTILPNDSGALLERNYAYNSPGWPQQIQDAALTEDLTYTRDSCSQSGYYNGMISHQTIHYQQGQEESDDLCFTVDSLNRLIQAGQGETATRWTMDDNGNFQSCSKGQSTKTYRYASGNNRLLSVTGSDGRNEREYNYDANGNVQRLDKHDSSIVFEYFKSNGKVQQITLSENSAETILDFSYDAGGLRTLKTVSGQSGTQTLTLPGLEIDRQAGNETAMRLIQAPGTVIIYCNGNYYFGLQDHLGSTRSLVDERGTVVGQYEYDVYGNTSVIQTPDFPFRYLYTGQFYDVETGLYAFPARMYDAAVGRFCSPDPRTQFYCPYVYAGNNPVLFIDPSGEISWQSILAITVGSIAIIGSIALTIATAGMAAPEAGAATSAVIAYIAGQAAIGAGVGDLAGGGAASVYYGATHTHQNEFNWGEWAANVGLGVGFGAVSGALAYGISAGVPLATGRLALSTTKKFLLDEALITTGYTLGGGVVSSLGNMASAAVGGGDIGTAAWQGFVLGAATGLFAGATRMAEKGIRLGMRWNFGANSNQKLQRIRFQTPNFKEDLTTGQRMVTQFYYEMKRSSSLYRLVKKSGAFFENDAGFIISGFASGPWLQFQDGGGASGVDPASSLAYSKADTLLDDDFRRYLSAISG